MSITPSYFEESVKNSLENCNTNVNLNKSILSDGIYIVCIYFRKIMTRKTPISIIK